MSDKSLLDSDSYTCVSSVWKTCSWLDHLLSTFDMHSSILDIKIDYSFILSDHHPLVFIINQNTIPSSISYNNCIIHNTIKWNRLDKKQILKYNIDTKFNLGTLINDIMIYILLVVILIIRITYIILY